MRAELRSRSRALADRRAARSLATPQSIWRKSSTLASYKSRVCEVNAWTALYGRLRRAHLTAEHVRKARATWIEEEYTPEDDQQPRADPPASVSGARWPKAPTPADDVKPLRCRSQRSARTGEVFRTVAANLIDAKTRARFMVIASTGVRPAELNGRNRPTWTSSGAVWAVRTAKGGAPRAFWLNDDMTAACKAFIAADAWGAL